MSIKQAALAGLLVLSAFAANNAAAADSATLAVAGVADFTPAFAATEEGFFAAQGLNVTIQVVPSAGHSVVALQSNSAQFGTVATASLLQAVDSGLDFVIVAGGAVAHKTDVNYAMVAKPEIKTPADLVGKTVAVNALESFFHVLLREWMTQNGVDYHKVTFVEAPLPSLGDALKAGTVDAIMTTEPFLSRIAAGGGVNVTYIAQSLPDNFQPFTYGTTRAYADAHPDAVKAFREGIRKGVAFVTDDPAKARADFGKYVKLPPEVIASIKINPLTTDVEPSQIEPWIRIMKAQGMLHTDIDAASLILH